MRFQFWILFRSSNKMCVPKSNSSYRVPIQSLTEWRRLRQATTQQNTSCRDRFQSQRSLSLFLWSFFCVYFFWVGSVQDALEIVQTLTELEQCSWERSAHGEHMLIAVPERGRERERKGMSERVLTTWAVTRHRERERERVSLQVLKTVSE